MDIKFFAGKYEQHSKVNISELKKGTIIYLITEHSVYKLEVLEPETAKVLASGGYFKVRKKEPCETYIVGSTIGGNVVFRKTLIEGLYCEFDQTVITSTIKIIYLNYPN